MVTRTSFIFLFLFLVVLSLFVNEKTKLRLLILNPSIGIKCLPRLTPCFYYHRLNQSTDFEIPKFCDERLGG